MSRFLSNPVRCGVVGAVLLAAILLSESQMLWLASIGAFVASIFVLGWHRARPLLVWIIATNMLSIWADTLIIEMNRRGWTTVAVELNQEQAIYYSLCALLIVAVGMRIGMTLGGAFLRDRAKVGAAEGEEIFFWSAQRIALAYFAFLPIGIVTGSLVDAASGLGQPIYVFGLLKFMLIYWLSATIFTVDRGYQWLLAVIATELVVGSTGVFSGYKEGFFVILIALVANHRRLSARQALVASVGTALVIYMSLVWTAVKQEFRSDVAGKSARGAIEWLADKYFGGDIDFSDATVALLERIGYTKFYALILNANTDSLQGIYGRAVLHIVTPRILFPDKGILDDSAQTNVALGWNIDSATSIGLGYVAQAHIDFGFPGMLLPMLLLGAFVGVIYSYFRSRPAPAPLCEAFAVGCLFNALAFAGNIDKQLGGLIWAFIVFSLALHFGGTKLLRLVEQSAKRERRAPLRLG